MKIQELFETTTEDCEILIEARFELPFSRTVDLYKRLKPYIKQIDYKVHTAYTNHDEAVVKLRNVLSSDQQTINTITEKLEQLYPKIFKTNKLQKIKVVYTFRELPKQPIVPVDYVKFIPSQKCTLSGIDKVFQHVKNLTISSYQNITGNVLGLFKLKDTKINLIIIHPSDREWMKTVEKYLPSGDLISCQEELMDKGLGKYAKF